MREKLIETIQNSVGGCARHWAEVIADGLIDSGVILPKCKIGDTICRIGDNGKIYADWEIICIRVYEEEILYIDDSDNYFNEDDIGKTVFLSRGDAEKALRGYSK